MGLPGPLRRLLGRLRGRVPAGARGRPGGEGPGRFDGGAGVREPRRPGPTRPGIAAAAPEPDPDQFVDLGDSRG